VPDLKSLRNLNGSHADVKSVELVAHDAPKSPVSEAIRNVKTSIFLSMPAASITSLVVSSAMPAEGKTFIAISIASVISSQQKRVLIVDADLRRPRIAQVFGCRRDAVGLTTLLTRNDVSLKKVIQRSRVPGLYFLSSGPLPPNPGGLLESDRMRSLSERFCDIFDLVVFDSPPVMGFADAQILAARADGVILVAKEGHVPMEMLRQAKASISLTKGKILGVVLNMAHAGGYGYGYYGKYGYRSRYYYYYHDYYSSEDSGRAPSGNGRRRRLLGRGKDS
jgi:capsular exopolysaccharide synthesis family protein